jgi:peptidoglycan/xylan/chitin deacetylase (PgdA/CDA1 family)
MVNEYYMPKRKQKKKSAARLLFFLFLLALIIALAIFGFKQYLLINSLQSDLDSLNEKIRQVEQENKRLQDEFDKIYKENIELREENYKLRSSTIIYHGNRSTNKVAITIDDGAGEELISRTLNYLRAHNVKATLFPMGSWVDLEPGIWRRAVEEGHELGNHTYSHAFLTTISEERIREELNRWQQSVDEALGYQYKTLYFRPPGMDGFTSTQSSRTKRFQEIIAEKGMVPILWDVELVYALRNEVATPARITEHVLTNARGGSIVLLHFTPNDIAALPHILEGLRKRGLEPCSLSELLLAEFKTS